MQPLPLSKLYLINLPYNIRISEDINLLFCGRMKDASVETSLKRSEIVGRKSNSILAEFRIQSRNRKLYRKQGGISKQLLKSGHDSPSRIEKTFVRSASFISLEGDDR